MELLEIGKQAKEAALKIANLGTNEKNSALCAVADALEEAAQEIIRANGLDLENGRNNGMREGCLTG